MNLTLLLVAVTVVISLYAWNKPEVMHKLIMNPYKVRHFGEFYRMITSGFIHADYGHLAFNMFSLYFMGRAVEQMFIVYSEDIGVGAVHFMVLYLAGIVISDLPTYFKYKDQSHYNSLGASGGVSAVIFSFIIFAPANTLLIMFIPMPAFVFGILYMIYSYIQGKSNRADHINHDAHFYGALFGVVYTLVMFPETAQGFIYQITHWGA